MKSRFHLAFCLCLISGLLISETWSTNVEKRSAGCHGGWRRYGARCFLRVGFAAKMDEAERHCIDHGGHLASIHSYGEQQFVSSLAGGRSWIGLHDLILVRNCKPTL
ncbi:type-2 ice-structuring protein-like [Centropristis striata]|uniref:type-2 ice-structuring protein-like n=1 Tax=Centropristis striata TaxID=184440 RepID=UPI0027E20817|nr:type-2 ice-structuring protein-like [Centropristis striata]